MEKGGFNPSKLHVLWNFIDSKKIEGPLPEKREHYSYVGRLSEEKGIRTLLQVAAELPFILNVIGSGPLADELKMQYSCYPQIHFLGQKEWNDIRDIVSSSIILVIPSEWYEVFGLVIGEALALGTPVIGAHIGAIPELISSLKSCNLYPPGDTLLLKSEIQEYFRLPRKSIQATYLMRGIEYIEKIERIYKHDN
jgi:glycosyltransferase involved in cell wall biosynthesis